MYALSSDCEEMISIRRSHQLRAPLKPLNTIMLWCSRGFRGAPQLGPHHCRETPVPRTAARLIGEGFPACCRNCYPRRKNVQFKGLELSGKVRRAGTSRHHGSRSERASLNPPEHYGNMVPWALIQGPQLAPLKCQITFFWSKIFSLARPPG